MIGLAKLQTSCLSNKTDKALYFEFWLHIYAISIETFSKRTDKTLASGKHE